MTCIKFIAAVLLLAVFLQGSEGKLKRPVYFSTKTYPWVVSVRVDGRHVCSGAIVSGNTVLTAKDCVKTETYSKSVDPVVSVHVGAGPNTLVGYNVTNSLIMNGEPAFFDPIDGDVIDPVSEDIILLMIDGTFKNSEYSQVIDHGSSNGLIGKTGLVTAFDTFGELYGLAVTFKDSGECYQYTKKYSPTEVCVERANDIYGLIDVSGAPIIYDGKVVGVFPMTICSKLSVHSVMNVGKFPDLVPYSVDNNYV